MEMSCSPINSPTLSSLPLILGIFMPRISTLSRRTSLFLVWFKFNPPANRMYLKLASISINKLCFLPHQCHGFLSVAVMNHHMEKATQGRKGFVQCIVLSLWGTQGRSSKHHIHSQDQRKKVIIPSLFVCLLTCLFACSISTSFPHC